jgi:hypothetical protein
MLRILRSTLVPRAAIALGLIVETEVMAMIESVLSASSLSSLLKELLSWLKRLQRENEERRRESIQAINGVITAARFTAQYSAARAQGHRSMDREAELAMKWTELSHRLDSLGITKLAKRCDIKGRYWADREKFSEDWLDQADIGLESVERLARQIKDDLKAAGK